MLGLLIWNEWFLQILNQKVVIVDCMKDLINLLIFLELANTKNAIKHSYHYILFKKKQQTLK